MFLTMLLLSGAQSRPRDTTQGHVGGVFWNYIFDSLESYFCLTDPKICVFKHIVI